MFLILSKKEIKLLLDVNVVKKIGDKLKVVKGYPIGCEIIESQPLKTGQENDNNISPINSRDPSKSTM